MSITDIIQIILSILSLISTIAISIVIAYWENKNAYHKEQQELSNKANNFIISNNLKYNKLENYISLAAIMVIEDPLYKPFRDIYLNFFKCDINLQNMILEHLHISLRISTHASIFFKCRLKWSHYEKENKIGDLGDLMKMCMFDFNSAIKYINSDVAECKQECFEIPEVSRTSKDFPCNKSYIKKVDLFEYIDHYLDYVYKTNTWEYIKNYPNLHLLYKPPFDVLNKKGKEENWSLKHRYMWYMWYVICTCNALWHHELITELHNRKYYLHVDTSVILTFEDLYAYMLLTLLNCFAGDEDIFPQKKSFVNRLISRRNRNSRSRRFPVKNNREDKQF